MKEEECLSPQSTENGAVQEPNAKCAPEVTTEVTTASPEQDDGKAKGEQGKADEKKALKKKRVKTILWNVFLVVIIALGILSLFGIVKEIDPDQGATLGEVVAGANLGNFFVLLAAVASLILLEVAMYSVISKTVTGKFMVATSAKCNFLGKYYDAVTPFSTGGQPMQIYYLNSKGISGGNSSAMVLIKYFASMLCWVGVGGACMIYGAVNGDLSRSVGDVILYGVNAATLLKVAGWIGIGINLFLPTFVGFFLIFPKLMYKLTVGVVKLGAKLRIVKDVEKTTVRATKVVTDFKTAFKVMATSPVKLIVLILICLAHAVLVFSMPFFVMRVFVQDLSESVLTVMALNAYTMFGVSFIPTPGNTGAMESLSGLAFSAVAGPTLVWSVLLWRLSAFYLFIFVGIGITVYDIIMKNVKAKRESNLLKK